jgi:hypothetical protein
MRRLSSRHQLWISMATACLCVGIAFIILTNTHQPSSELLPVSGADLPIKQNKEEKTVVDQKGQEALLLSGLNCLRQKEGLPSFEMFDPVLSKTAGQALARLYYEDKALEALEGYTIRALIALDFSRESDSCVIAGLDLTFLAPIGDTTSVGIALSSTTSYGTTSAVLLGR